MSEQKPEEKVTKKVTKKAPAKKAEKKELDFEAVQRIGKKLNLSEHKCQILFNELKKVL